MRCRICHNAVNNKEYSVNEMMLGLDESHAYFECSSCGCLQISRVPEDLSRYYPDNYYSFNQDSTGWANKLINSARLHRDRYAFGQLDLPGYLVNLVYPSPYRKYITADMKNSRILDIGCGDGFLLKHLADVGFEHLYGYDLFIEEDIFYKTSVRIFRSYEKLQGLYDLIMFNHSFEHIQDPLDTLLMVSKLLEKNGKCVIRIPTTSSYAWKKYGVHWVQIDAPRHFFIHSINSMRLLASQAGFTVEDHYYDSTDFQFWGSEQYLRGIPLTSSSSYAVNPGNSTFASSDIRMYKTKAKKLNADRYGDQAVIILCKN